MICTFSIFVLIVFVFVRWCSLVYKYNFKKKAVYLKHALFFYRITLKMDMNVAARIVALRPCIEAFVVRSCLDPQSTISLSEADIRLLSILKQISSPVEWIRNAEKNRDRNANFAAVFRGNHARGYVSK